MTTPFYAGQQDYINQLNILANGGAAYTPLTITKTGNFLYSPTAPRLPMPMIDNLDGTLGTPPTGKAIGSFLYNEGLGISSSASTLTSLVFNDLAAAYVINISNAPAIATLGFPALTLAGAGATAGFTSFSLAGLPALTSLDLSAMQYCYGTVSISSMPVLTSLSLAALVFCQGLQVSAAVTLSTLSAPLLQTVSGALQLSNHALTTLSLPSLVALTQGCLISASNTTLTTISMPALVSVGGGSFSVIAHTAVATITLTALRNLLGLSISNTAALTSFSLPAAVEIGTNAFSIASCTNLATFSMGSTLKRCLGNFAVTACALNQASVDGILARLAALDGTNGTTAFSSPLTVNLTGGTSSTPSAAGLASKAILVARGVTVTHN